MSDQQLFLLRGVFFHHRYVYNTNREKDESLQEIQSLKTTSQVVIKRESNEKIKESLSQSILKY